MGTRFGAAPPPAKRGVRFPEMSFSPVDLPETVLRLLPWVKTHLGQKVAASLCECWQPLRPRSPPRSRAHPEHASDRPAEAGRPAGRGVTGPRPGATPAGCWEAICIRRPVPGEGTGVHEPESGRRTPPGRPARGDPAAA